ncbi:MAG: redoxin family protein [Planctomycetes bacterium]|nr:redoxin family protein [Planctomycetota bacterium]
MSPNRQRWLRAALVAAAASNADSVWAANPTATDALQLQPTQRDVEYDRPAADVAAKCTIKAEQINGHTGWVVRDAEARILRRFVDTNNDNVVDQWCYYLNGIEVYRDIDLNFNGKADQLRWLNSAGTRWGIDANEDGKIDSWKLISAEEVSAELVRAIGDRDSARFNRVLITEDEIASLGLGTEQSETLKKQVQAAGDKFRTFVSSKKESATRFASAGNKLRWTHFGGTLPGLVPAGTAGATKDVVAYENVAAMVQLDDKHEQIMVGTLVRVGDSWRLIDAPPAPSDSNELAAGSGFFFSSEATPRPEMPAGPGGTDGSQPAEVTDLMAKVEKLDQELGAAVAAKKPALHAQRAKLLDDLIRQTTGETRALWVRQLADTCSAAAQMGEFPEGVAILEATAKKLEANPADAELAAFVEYRFLQADYGVRVSDPKMDFVKTQQRWLDGLQAFISKYPKVADTADALLQLAVAKEFAGQEDDAKKVYGQLVAGFPESQPAKKATGAIARLDSVGKVIQLAGKNLTGQAVNLGQFRDKVIVLHYWASNSPTCLGDLETLKQLQAKYGKNVAIVGISLDDNRKALEDFLKKNKLAWVQIYDDGGLDAPLANALGILTLPSIMVIDKQGRVANRAATAGELDKEVGALLR